MRNGIYVHPWDTAALGRDGLGRLAALGFSELAFASAYHAGRWLTPRGAGLVRFLEDGIVHFRPEPSRSLLQARASREVAATGPSPLERACADAAAAGLGVSAWTVLFHNSRLGRAHADSCVRNALGDVYRYALCPARPEVQEYGLGIVRDLGGHALQTVELEAAGFMGHKHGSHHDKGSFVATPYTDFLLSFCLCSACVAGLDAVGVPGGGERLRARVAELLRERLVAGDVLEARDDASERRALLDHLGEPVLQAMTAHRGNVNAAFLRAARDALPASIRLAVHLQPDPMYTGSEMGAPLAAVAGIVDEVVFTHYGQGPAGIERAFASEERRADGVATLVSIWPKAPQFNGEDDVRAAARIAAEGGCDGLRVYHLGLLPERTVQRVAAALA